jgi:putative YhdH/YhfP family quinone oxidoreductase
VSSTYPAIVASEAGPASLTELTDADLPEGDVTVDVSHSSLNFKDGLAVTGRGPIIRRFPMVCGIDLAGTVAESQSPEWAPGQEVVVTGFGLSETHPGGYTRRQRVRAEWLVARPAAFSAARAMAVGTAGLTAMLCVLALERAGVGPDSEGEVLVTGAGGGVGSVAVALLARSGYRVAAGTGRPEVHDYLRGLGAARFVDRAELAATGRPLAHEQWAGAVDTVGSTVLATVLSQVRYGGAVAACGLAAGNDLPTTVLPFILRAVSLVGVESVVCPIPQRLEAWERLGRTLPIDLLDAMTTVEPLARVPALAEDIVAGRTRGRVVIDVNA